MDGSGRRPLRNFITPGVQGLSSSIAMPNVEAHNFELKPGLIFVVQQVQFGGTLIEDPNLHLLVFLEVCDTLKLNVQLFPFYLKTRRRCGFIHFLQG